MICMKPWREEWNKTTSRRQFHRQEKLWTIDFRSAVNLDFGCLTRRGLLDEPMNPGISGEGRRTEIADGANQRKGG